jgi:acetate kinase
MDKTLVMAKGIVEKVGMKGSFLKHEKEDGSKVRFEGEILDHQTGIEYILGVMTSDNHGCLKDLDDIDAVGHRCVHGGEKFSESVLITNEVYETMQEVTDLAPLHNPANLKGIDAMSDLVENVPQVAVFDTAFHQTMPEHAYMYAIPYSLYKKYGIRRYGFHGTSHRYISKRACDVLGVDIKDMKIITCHLGNGASMTAIRDGVSVDTSMGLTPVEGLMMGTRTGDLDLGVLTHIMNKEEISLRAANTLINKHSGVLGVTGISSDMREVEEEAWEKGNPRAQLGLDMYFYRVKKYIGSYAAAMGGVDLIIFSGGIGENGPETREIVCQGLEFLGVEFDVEKNHGLRGKEAIISTSNSKVKVMVVPTNEELVIARDTQEIVKKLK